MRRCLLHRFYFFLDEGYFLWRKSVFSIELAVDLFNLLRPIYIRCGSEVLQGDKSPGFFRVVLSYFDDTEHRTSKLCLNVFKTSFCFCSFIEDTNTDKSISSPN